MSLWMLLRIVPLSQMVLVPALPPPDPDPFKYGYVGVMIQQQNNQITISEVKPNTPAQKAGLRMGDQIVQVGRYKVNSSDEVIGLVATVRPGSIVRLGVLRGGKPLMLRIRVTERPEELQAPPPAPTVLPKEVVDPVDAPPK